ncbi:DUF1028 domain-containing protein [Spirosoma sp. HMF4905]|uniref:DUF1028 domain-containing protein n=1 Tax=Spirosoma arboris TaxID=2682092 RepID=A0A7K1SIZ4_9BACT|nr:DUF1028 domain-containing protein [Spirosoma arboris]MVM33791.1 DUF1028 domain-containing protein [Spirosoma arboris]
MTFLKQSHPSTLRNLTTLLIGFGCTFSLFVQAQNLPSLLTERPFNSTFSIVAYDAKAQQWGIAVATNNIYVGNSTIYIQPGVGAISVIAETLPDYGINGLKQLSQGKLPEEAINFTRQTDDQADYRQVSVVDKQGRAYAFTGHSLTYMKGQAGHRIGNGYVVMGNQLADSVLTRMAHTYEQATGTLAQRLVASLIAGQKAGGQVNGKQSAALVVKETQDEWFNQIDLRVDHSYTPFDDLHRLLNYHNGRPFLNQAITQLRMGNRERGMGLLHRADTLVKGWYGIYSKLATAYSLAGQDEKALAVIQDALQHEPAWRENLSAFYYLRSYPTYRKLIDETKFTVKDWSNAIQQTLNLGKAAEALKLANQLADRYPQATYIAYLQGNAYKANKDVINAKVCYQKALRLDPQNADARRALQTLP